MGVFQDRMNDEMTVRHFSPNSEKAYRLAMRAFVKYFMKAPDLLGLKDIRRYQLHMVSDRKSAASTVNQHMSAIRFFYRDVLRVPWTLDELPHYKVGEKLPMVLS